jgi:hypothetical protein
VAPHLQGCACDEEPVVGLESADHLAELAVLILDAMRFVDDYVTPVKLLPVVLLL